MKVKREEENLLYTLITVKPWPDEPWAADVSVIQKKVDTETGQKINRVRVRYGQHPLPIQTAFEFAQAILRACDIAEQLEREGTVILEGESVACPECGTRHAPGRNTLCSD